MKKTLWKIVAAAVAVLLTPLAASAGSVYQECSPCAPNCGPKKSLWEVGGWIDAGIYGNEYGQENTYAAGQLDGNSGNTALLQNVRQSDFQMNQMWIFAQKKLSKRGFSVGGRVDVAYGTDMVFLQSENLEFAYAENGGDDRWQSGDYYTALPQLYAEVGYNNLSVKAGKFLNPLGHESIMSPDRFFYSLSYAYAVNPSTLTGVVATWDVSKKLSVYGGWVSGEDRTFETENDNAFLGGIKWQAGKRLNVSYGLIVGEEDPWFFNPNKREYFVHSFVVNFKPNKRWDYTFEWTLRNENATINTAWNGGGYGINQELIYTLNKRWSFGVRAEWMHVYGNFFNDGKNILPGLANADDAFAVTLGANWKPTRHFTLRPEIRYDVVDNATPFNGPQSGFGDMKDNQLSGGISAVLHF